MNANRKRTSIADLGTYANTFVDLNKVVLHQTTIADFGVGWVAFFNGGFLTATTKKRINEICEILNLDWRVAQKSKKWVWRNTETGETKPHAEGIKFSV